MKLMNVNGQIVVDLPDETKKLLEKLIVLLEANTNETSAPEVSRAEIQTYMHHLVSQGFGDQIKGLFQKHGGVNRFSALPESELASFYEDLKCLH